jgi:hypothetical protein
VVVCSAGYASSLAAETLATMGYRHASDLAGGYQAWSSWRTSSGPLSHQVGQGT